MDVGLKNPTIWLQTQLDIFPNVLKAIIQLMLTSNQAELEQFPCKKVGRILFNISNKLLSIFICFILITKVTLFCVHP